jgi:hypothetical protein
MRAFQQFRLHKPLTFHPKAPSVLPFDSCSNRSATSGGFWLSVAQLFPDSLSAAPTPTTFSPRSFHDAVLFDVALRREKENTNNVSEFLKIFPLDSPRCAMFDGIVNHTAARHAPPA